MKALIGVWRSVSSSVSNGVAVIGSLQSTSPDLAFFVSQDILPTSSSTCALSSKITERSVSTIDKLTAYSPPRNDRLSSVLANSCYAPTKNGPFGRSAPIKIGPVDGPVCTHYSV